MTVPDKKGLGALLTGEGVGKNHPLYVAIGGVLGIFETILPGIIFVKLLGFTRNPLLAIWISVGVSVVFALYRVIRRQQLTQALVGLLGVIASALLATLSNRPEDNFVLGLITNSIYAGIFLLSAVIRWPIIGVAVGLFRGDQSAWRKNKHHMRVFTGLTLMWSGMFALRVIVQYPLYISGNLDGLAIAKLLLGLPIYVPVLALTWLVVRSLSKEKNQEQLSQEDRKR